jgi:hypothetical protein
MMSKVTVYEVQPHDDDVISFVAPEKPQQLLFLAGTIDMGNSEDWQDSFVKELRKMKDRGVEYIVYNPRRDEGFNDDKKEFEYQVNWELERLERSDRIVMHILGTSKSPITLMELGLFARSHKLDVICESDFYRYGNVEIVCKRYEVPLYNSMTEYLKHFKNAK